MCGEPGDGYGGKGLGWTYRDEKALGHFGRPLENPLVEDLLIAAILRINPAVMERAKQWLSVNAEKLLVNLQMIDLKPSLGLEEETGRSSA